jgi:hypothetical protein
MYDSIVKAVILLRTGLVEHGSQRPIWYHDFVVGRAQGRD